MLLFVLFCVNGNMMMMMVVVVVAVAAVVVVVYLVAGIAATSVSGDHLLM